MIRRDMYIEELLTALPQSVGYLMDRGIKPLVCGEPIWDTLEGAAKAKGMTDEDIDRMVTELEQLRAGQKESVKA